MKALFDTIWTWIWSHPASSFAICMYLVANLAPRPNHEKLTGWKKAVWGTIDRLCFLTSGALPGVFKALFSPTPLVALEPDVKSAAEAVSEEVKATEAADKPTDDAPCDADATVPVVSNTPDEEVTKP